MTSVNEEKRLLKMLADGLFDGPVGVGCYTTGGSTVWKVIKDGIPIMCKQGPTRKYFDGKENVKVDGVFRVLQKWCSDEEKLNFIRKYGWLIENPIAKTYSAKFKPQR
jgi:hypothetical protein